MGEPAAVARTAVETQQQRTGLRPAGIGGTAAPPSPRAAAAAPPSPRAAAAAPPRAAAAAPRAVAAAPRAVAAVAATPPAAVAAAPPRAVAAAPRAVAAAPPRAVAAAPPRAVAAVAGAPPAAGLSPLSLPTVPLRASVWGGGGPAREFYPSEDALKMRLAEVRRIEANPDDFTPKNFNNAKKQYMIARKAYLEEGGSTDIYPRYD